MRQMLITLVPAVVVLLATAMASLAMDLEPSLFTRDITAITNRHPIMGALSMLGVVLWGVTASVCLFAAAVVKHANHTRFHRFLLFSALLSAYLMFDDAFRFHEDLASDYLRMDEKLVMVALGAAVVWYLLAFRQLILGTRFPVLLLALALLGSSVLIDIVFESWSAMHDGWATFVEDGAKWLGIACWCSYYLQTCHASVLSATTTART